MESAMMAYRQRVQEGSALLADLRGAGLRIWLQDAAGYSEEFTILVAPRRLVTERISGQVALTKEALIDALYAEHWDRVFPTWGSL